MYNTTALIYAPMPSRKFATRTMHRHSIRLKGYDYSAAGGYYITIATLYRECLFGEILDGEMIRNALGEIVQECWNEIPSHFPNVEAGAFTVMPNHAHGIIVIHEKKISVVVGAQHAAPLPQPSSLVPVEGGIPNVKPGSLGAIVRSFKSAVTRRAGRELNVSNIWQRNYYEHIIRNQTDYERIVNYIVTNPISWMQDDENPQNPVTA